MGKKLSTKTFLLSMVVVFLLGLGSIVGVYLIVNPKNNNNPLISEGPVTSEPVSLILNLTSPDDNTLVFDSDLLIQGQVSKGSFVLLSLNEEDQILDTSDKGDLSKTIKLEDGVNKIMVTVFDNLGNSKTEKRTVFYSTEKI